MDNIKTVLNSYDMVVLQHEIPLETVHYVIDFCHQNKVPVILNPAPAAKVPLDIVDKVTFLGRYALCERCFFCKIIAGLPQAK